MDLGRGVLTRNGQEVALRPKSFEALTYLVERHGQLVTKSSLIEAVWPDTAVGDNSLAQCLFDIRRALGDDSQGLIRTKARRGYIFTPRVTTPVVEFPTVTGPLPIESPRRPQRKVVIAVFAPAAIALLALLLFFPRQTGKQGLTYEQITNFTDSVVSPALSPDGRILAFIRSEQWFLSPGQIYVKMLPNGEPVQITHDPRQKYGPTFSPDGSRIIYSTPMWSTYSVSTLGGEPALFLENSSGVTWLDEHHILFSEVRPPTSVHMGVVTAMEDRSQGRTVYFPKEERGMVHLSYASPDRKWVLVLEMNPIWQPCRVVPLDGSSSGRQVGPDGSCISAAWSPDGKWMYFAVATEVSGAHHLWRQRFPQGKPEQITFGPTEEDGLAPAPDGRSLITSIGMQQSAIWIHDARGDRSISSHGDVAYPEARSGLKLTYPIFSQDGKSLFYLSSESPGQPQELWRADLATDESARVLPGVSMLEFDISDDGKEVVYSVQAAGKPSQIWLARLDRSSPPHPVSDSDEDFPHFGPDGHILYRSFDGTNYYFEQMNRDGSGRSKVSAYAVGNGISISTDRRWLTAVGTMPDGMGGTYAIPISGGNPQRICSGCFVLWAPGGKFLYVSVPNAHKTRVFSLGSGEMLPRLPRMGEAENLTLFPGTRLIDGYICPGPDPSVYAYVKTTMHRNLFRIHLPN
jgi:DNA-binding winged helix-turn-helix (wHTH) protein/Tol biopolymer transport system component